MHKKDPPDISSRMDWATRPPYSHVWWKSIRRPRKPLKAASHFLYRPRGGPHQTLRHIYTHPLLWERETCLPHLRLGIKAYRCFQVIMSSQMVLGYGVNIITETKYRDSLRMKDLLCLGKRKFAYRLCWLGCSSLWISLSLQIYQHSFLFICTGLYPCASTCNRLMSISKYG